MKGRVIAGRFRLEYEIGSGAMGTVWRAEHLALAVPVAIKLMSSGAARKQDALARFEREARLAARIRSAYVVGVLDHGRDENLPYIVMEWLEGESLRERLDRLGRLPLPETARLVTHVCRALGQAHELGLVHRDIKPENVFAARIDGDAGEAYKVLDFGVAKVTDQMTVDGVRTKTGSLLGTPFYMSPEQARGLKTLDHRADLWSVGVLAFECLTGRRPFSGKALGPLIFKIVDSVIPVPSEVAPDAGISREVDAWMEQALRRDPEERFQSARELAGAFRLAAGLSERGDLDQSAVPFIPAEPSLVTMTAIEEPTEEPRGASLSGTLVMTEGLELDTLGVRQTVALDGRPFDSAEADTAATLAFAGSADDTRQTALFDRSAAHGPRGAASVALTVDQTNESALVDAQTVRAGDWPAADAQAAPAATAAASRGTLSKPRVGVALGIAAGIGVAGAALFLLWPSLDQSASPAASSTASQAPTAAGDTSSVPAAPDSQGSEPVEGTADPAGAGLASPSGVGSTGGIAGAGAEQPTAGAHANSVGAPSSRNSGDGTSKTPPPSHPVAPPPATQSPGFSHRRTLD